MTDSTSRPARGLPSTDPETTRCFFVDVRVLAADFLVDFADFLRCLVLRTGSAVDDRFFRGVFFLLGFLLGDLLAVARLAVDFLGAGFFVDLFLVATRDDVDFFFVVARVAGFDFAAVLFVLVLSLAAFLLLAGGFLVVPLVAGFVFAAFFLTVFLRVDFLVADAFLATGFLVADFFLAGAFFEVRFFRWPAELVETFRVVAFFAAMLAVSPRASMLSLESPPHCVRAEMTYQPDSATRLQ